MSDDGRAVGAGLDRTASGAARARTAARRQRALELRIEGKTVRQIAAELGVSKTQIGKDLQRELAALDQANQASAAELRALELERLDTLDAKVRVGLEAETDPRLVREAIRVSEQRSKLLGLYAPTKVEHLLEPGQVQAVLGAAFSGGLGAVVEVIEFACSLVDMASAERMRVYGEEQKNAWIADFEQRVGELISGDAAAPGVVDVEAEEADADG